MDRVVGTTSDTLIASYEKRIRESEARKIELAENLANCARRPMSFDAAFRTAMTFFANPCKMWVSERLDLQQLVLKLVFVGRLEYVRGSGFRTPLTSPPFTLLSAAEGGNGNFCELAHPDGACSNQLDELFATLADWNACLSEVPPEILNASDPPDIPEP